MRQRLQWRWLNWLAWQVRWARWRLHRLLARRKRRVRPQRAAVRRTPRPPVRPQLEPLDGRVLPGEAASPLLISLAAISTVALPRPAIANPPAETPASTTAKDESLPPSLDYSWLLSGNNSGSDDTDAGNGSIVASSATTEEEDVSPLWSVGADDPPASPPAAPLGTQTPPPALLPNNANKAGAGVGPGGRSTNNPTGGGGSGGGGSAHLGLPSLPQLQSMLPDGASMASLPALAAGGNSGSAGATTASEPAPSNANTSNAAAATSSAANSNAASPVQEPGQSSASMPASHLPSLPTRGLKTPSLPSLPNSLPSLTTPGTGSTPLGLGVGGKATPSGSLSWHPPSLVSTALPSGTGDTPRPLTTTSGAPGGAGSTAASTVSPSNMDPPPPPPPPPGSDSGSSTPTVEFSASAYGASETAGSIDVEVDLNFAASQTVTVQYQTSDNTALAGTDYVSVSGTLIFDPGQTSQDITVQILDDGDDDESDNNQSFVLVLSNASGANLGTPDLATVTISEDSSPPPPPPPPPPTVEFYASNYSIGEQAGSVSVSVVLSAVSTQTVTVQYQTNDDTAVAGTDYTSVSGTLSFAPGQTSQPLTVQILDDGDDDESDSTQTFVLVLSNASGANLGTPSEASVTISEDSSPPPPPPPPPPSGTVEFYASDYPIDEQAGFVNVYVELTNHTSNQTVTVQYQTSDGTAKAGTDYTNTSGTLTFYTYSSSLIDVFTVPILDDGDDDEDIPTKTFDVTLSDPSGATLGTPSEASVNIDEPPVGTAFAAIEGQSFTGVVASFYGSEVPNYNSYAALILWGDNTLSQGEIVANDNGGWNVVGTHTYAEEGPYTVAVAITDFDVVPLNEANSVVEERTSVAVTFGLVINPTQDTQLQAASSVSLAYQSSGDSSGSDGACDYSYLRNYDQSGNYDLSTSGTLSYQLSKTVYTPTGSTTTQDNASLSYLTQGSGSDSPVFGSSCTKILTP